MQIVILTVVLLQSLSNLRVSNEISAWKRIINSHCVLTCKWLFLRDCGHLTNARDLVNAKHLRGALIAENPEECSHSFGYISNSIHNIYSYYLYSLYYFYHDYLCGFIYFYHQCVYYFFLFLLPFYLLGLFSALLFLIVLHCYLYLYQFYIYYPIATVQYRLNQPYEPRRRYKMP